MNESTYTNMSFKVASMPNLSRELSKTMNKWGFAVLIIAGNEKEISQGSDSHQRLNSDIHKIIFLNIVKPHL